MTSPRSISARTKGDMMAKCDADLEILDVAMDVWTLLTHEEAPEPDQGRWAEFEVLWEGVARRWVPGGHRRALLHACLADWTPVALMSLPEEVTLRGAKPTALPSQMLH